MFRRVLLFCMMAFLSQGSVHAESINMVGQSWFPYMGREGDPLPGFLVEVAAEALALKHHQPSFRIIPWQLANQEVAEGISTALIGTTPQENPNFIFGKEPLGLSANSFFVRSENSWTYQNIESLKGLRVGYIEGGNYGEEFAKAVASKIFKPVSVSGSGASHLNVRKLLKGEVDVILDDFNVVEAVAHKLESSSKIKRAGFLHDPEPVYLGWSPKIKDAQILADDLDEGIAQLKASGGMKKIFNKYGLEVEEFNSKANTSSVKFVPIENSAPNAP